MSVTFRPCLTTTGRPLLRCACADEDPGAPGFTPCAACDATLNLNNRNGYDLLVWLNVPGNEDPELGLYGSIKASELVALCNRRLWPEDRNSDPAIETVRVGRAIFMGRETNYLQRRTMDLREIAVMAGDFYVCWS